LREQGPLEVAGPGVVAEAVGAGEEEGGVARRII